MLRTVKHLGLIAALLVSIASMTYAQNAYSADAWTDIMPTIKNTDINATSVARKVLKDDVKKFFNDGKTPLTAKFFNAPGLEKDSVLIVTFISSTTCGTMGCNAYFLKRAPGKDNKWHIMDDTLVNGIVTSPALLARQPAFYVKRSDTPYVRFNAATERYEK